MSGFDWVGLMRAGLRDLRLTPDAFWRLTPFELTVMLGADGAAPGLTRARLNDLVAAYPDGRKANINDATGGFDGSDCRP